jgi:beta-glucosidase
LTLEEKVSLMMNASAPIERLGIKEYDWWNEALHGIARNGLGTVFPMPIGMAASFDPEALHDVFVTVSDEARAKNTKAIQEGSSKQYQGLTVWTPNINIFRDPRWGRGIETYGEDPYLTATLGVEVVKGLQCLGEDEKYDKLHACAKHFAVHSGPEWNRHEFNAENIKPRDLYETYLPAFEALVKDANVKEVMCAYNRFEGEPCCDSDQLLIHILRNEWNYQGLVVSDCWAIPDFYRKKNSHQTHPDAASASASAVLSGTDLECGSSYESLVDGVKRGLIKETDIDVSVKRLLKARYELGEMDDPKEVSWTKIPYSIVASKEHHVQALDMARKSMTLLQNKNNTLPLKRGGKTIAVMGPNANDSIMQWGNYNGIPASTITILEGIRRSAGKDDKVIYVPGCSWVETTLTLEDQTKVEVNIPQTIAQVKDADVVIFVGGITPRLEGEEMGVDLPGFRGGDRTDIELPAIQRQMLKALKSSGKKVVLVNCSGSAIGLEPETQSCDAILQAWYPGEAGGQAVAEVLFGDYNPSGRLPVTFYKNINQLPDFEDYNMTGRTYRYFKDEPLFPFGYGLSYTTFAYGEMQAPASAKVNKTFKVTIPITNQGSIDGDEIVQLYLKKQDDEEGPIKALRAYKRVHIPAGKTIQVELELTPKQLVWWDKETNTMRTQTGTFDIMIGGNSNELTTQAIKIE